MRTPGPWTFDADWRRFPTVYGRDGIKVAIIERDKDIKGFVYELPERYDNARLITAAPELLEALHNVRKLIAEAAMTGFNCNDGDWAERLFASQQMTSAAIKKAEGSTLKSPDQP